MNEYRGKHISSRPWPTSSGRPVRRGRHQMRNRRRRRWVTLWVILLLMMLAWPFVEARILSTDRVILPMDDLPLEANHLHVVFVSDIHYGFWYSDIDLNRLAAHINSLKPDVVLFGGGYGVDIPSAVRFFQRLPSIHARYAILGVLGDTDHGETDYELSTLTDAMRNAGVIPLVNDVHPLRVGTATLYIAGADDVSSLKSLSASVSTSDFVILLSHSPALIPEAQLATDSAGRLGWFDLGLFGHTHGGQILFLSDLLGFGEDVPARYRSGWLKENRVNLLISRGVGTLKIPARLFCSPQVHLIELTVN